MHFFIFSLLSVLISSQAAEWSTSSGLYCISKCQENDDGIYKCPVVDGYMKNFRPTMDQENSGRPNVHGDEKESAIPMDYCTPDHKASLNENNENNGHSQAETLPSHISDNEEGQDVFDTGGKDESSLPGYKCEGSCHKMSKGYHKCSISGHPTHTDFFCSPNQDLKREQLTSVNKMWCLDKCWKGESDVYYMCKTLYGTDRCSPTKDRSSQGEICLSPCLANTDDENHNYQCQVDKEDPPTLDNCGFWYNDTAKTKALEYTADEKVCANPCSEEKLCLYVDWKEVKLNSIGHGDELTVLTLNEDYCGGEIGIDWTLVGSIIATVVVVLILVAMLAIYLVKKPYQRANMSE